MTAAETTSTGRRKSPLVVLFLIVVIDLIGFGIVLPLLPRYGERYGVSPIALGFLMASFSAMQFVFAPFWGRLSDRKGRRPILMVGLLGSVLSYTMFGFADSFALLLISRLAAGFFGATIGAAQAYIADVTPQAERGRGMALIGAAFGLGFTIGPAIGGYASARLSHSAPGFIAAGLSAAAFALAVVALPEPPSHRERAERHLLDTTAIRHALATPTIPLILALQFVATFAFASFEATLSLLTKAAWHYDEEANAKVFTFVGLVLVMSQGFVVRRLMPRVGELRFVVLGALLMAAGLGGLSWSASAASVPAMYVALAVAVLGFAMVTPSLASLLSRRTPAAHQGEVLGLGQSMLSMARILGPIWGNWLFGLSWTMPHVAAANILLVAFLGALVLARAPAPDAGTPPPLR
jgi:multidrug resistance protein